MSTGITRTTKLFTGPGAVSTSAGGAARVVRPSGSCSLTVGTQTTEPDASLTGPAFAAGARPSQWRSPDPCPPDALAVTAPTDVSGDGAAPIGAISRFRATTSARLAPAIALPARRKAASLEVHGRAALGSGWRMR